MGMNLEDRFFYRLFNVMYFFSNTVFSITIFTFLYIAIPPASDIIDSGKSCIVCKSGDKYPMLGLYNFLEKRGSKILLTNDGIELANMLCSSSINIAQFRAKYPQYNDLSDTEIADKLHSKYYYDIPKAHFYSKFGVLSGVKKDDNKEKKEEVIEIYKPKQNDEVEVYKPNSEWDSYPTVEENNQYEDKPGDASFDWSKYEDKPESVPMPQTSNDVLEISRRTALKSNLKLDKVREKLKKQGIYLSITPEEAIAELQRRGIHAANTHLNFSLKILYTSRDWFSYGVKVFWCVIIATIYYFVVNLTRETLIYLVFGRRFAWNWLLDFIKFIQRMISIFKFRILLHLKNFRMRAESSKSQ